MKYIYAKFVNYIGFYLGMDLDVVEIDFTRCKSNLILIVGKNASGKSTLENHLNPFPDPSGSYIEGRTAEKYLSLVDISGDRYDIHIVSEADNKGGRKTTKGFIQKNGIELNPNGNISSYKEILFSEFELDSNYNSLSMLSSVDRGMGDKTPAERKKFISSIMENLEVYNNIYKSLNKKSLVFKSHINTLHTKIQNIGDKASLELNLQNLKNEETSILQKIMKCRDEISALQTKCNMNEDKAEEFKNIKLKLQELESVRDGYLLDLKRLRSNYNIKDKDIYNKYESDKTLYNSYLEKDKILESSLTDIKSRIANIYDKQRNIKSKIEGKSFNIDRSLHKEFDSVSAKLKEYDISRDKYISKKSSNIFKINSFNFTMDNYYGLKNIYDGLIELMSYIDRLYDNLSDNEYLYLFDPDNIDSIEKLIVSLNNSILDINASIDETNRLINLSEIYNKKPDSCKNENCPFVKEAFEAKSLIEKGNFISNLDKKQIELDKINNKINQISILKDKLDNFILYLDRLVSDKFSLLLDYNKLDSATIINIILKDISIRNSFNYIVDIMEEYKILSNTVNHYISLSNTYNNLKVKIESQVETEKLIKEYNDMLSEFDVDLKNLNKDRDETISKIDSNTKLINTLKDILPIEKNYIDISDNISSVNKEIDIINDKINEYSSNIGDTEKMIETIYSLNDSIAKYTDTLDPIQNNISNITGQLALINSYYVEFNEYKSKYDTIEIIKKYCSPTGGGIQTLFMELYMSKTLELSNDILKMLFDGQYMLTDFVINEKEFRIPFLNNGMIVDDISNGSMSQVCMMGMIINLVLLYQGSTKFNIPRLDEPDASLDSRNRSMFMQVLWNCKNILQIDQLFIISHSIEEDMSNCDVILLKTYDNYDLGSSYNMNVIWDYKEA